MKELYNLADIVISSIVCTVEDLVLSFVSLISGIILVSSETVLITQETKKACITYLIAKMPVIGFLISACSAFAFTLGVLGIRIR